MIELRRLEAGTADVPALQALHLRCADFVEATWGRAPRGDEAAWMTGCRIWERR